MKRLAPVFGLLCLLLWPAVALAHPLGNFTVNRYSRIEPDAANVRIRYVLDMAEIPTFQELPAVGAGYPERKAAELAAGAHLQVDGVAVPLTPHNPNLSLVAGQGGLQTLRLTAWLEAPLRGSRIEYEDTNYRGRVGWSEIVLPGQTDTSHELLTYPNDMLASPLDQHTASFTIGDAAHPATAAGGATVFRTVLQAATGGGSIAKAKDAFAGLLSPNELSFVVVLFSVLAALILGALHALSPGHGKTVVGAFLVGSRGTARQAVMLGLTVTATHTAGVFALGLATLFASKYILPEQLFPWLGAASGALVAAIGLGLFAPRLRAALSGGHTHIGGEAHHHDGEGHAHAHAHAHPHAHADGGQHSVRSPRPGARQILALGISGGLLPCPSALVVLLSAISLHRVGLGLILIVAFSAGLASVLTVIGLLLVYAGSFLGRLRAPGRLALILPAASALVVVLAGLAIGAQGLSQAGVLNL